MDTAFETQIENLLDSSTLHDTLEAVATACYAKADHLRSNWQDEHSAKQWEAAAKALNRVLNVAAIRSL